MRHKGPVDLEFVHHIPCIVRAHKMNRNARTSILRSELTRHRGKSTTDEIWALLEIDRYPSEGLAATARRADELEKILDANPLRRQRRLRGAGLRAEAISRLLAGRARQDPAVILFRSEHLAGGFI